MNAIEMLTQQHRDVDELFEEFEDTGERARKTRERICQQVVDALAVHAQIEERIFYPEAREAAKDEAEELLREAAEEHQLVKNLMAELMATQSDDPQYAARMKVLKEQVQHHVQEEEGELFPKVRKACSEDQLEEMGDRMQELADQLLEAGQPSQTIPDQADKPASL